MMLTRWMKRRAERGTPQYSPRPTARPQVPLRASTDRQSQGVHFDETQQPHSPDDDSYPFMLGPDHRSSDNLCCRGLARRRDFSGKVFSEGPQLRWPGLLGDSKGRNVCMAGVLKPMRSPRFGR